MRTAITLLTIAFAAAKTADDWQIKQTFVINLARDTERMKSMRRQLAYLRVPYLRIHGVDKDDLRRAVDNNAKDPATLGLVDTRISKRINMSTLAQPPFSDFYQKDLGTAGCAFSHAHAMLTAIDNVKHGQRAQGPILVLEDDVDLGRDFVDQAYKAMNRLTLRDRDWSLLALGHCWAAGLDGPRKSHQLVARPERHYCSHAYVVRNTDVAHKLLRHFWKDNDVVPVWDLMVLGMYDTDEKWNDFRVYAYVDNDIVVQNRKAFDQHVPQAAPIPDLQVRNPIPHVESVVVTAAKDVSVRVKDDLESSDL